MSFANIPRPTKNLEVVPTTAPKKPLSNLDKKMLEELLEIFNRDFISFYTHHDFRASFRGDYWNLLSRFVDTWDDVTHEFIDEELEVYKKQLYTKSDKLASLISQFTVSDGYGLYSIYPRRQISEEQRERFRAEGQEINLACLPFLEECERFIRYARKRLSEN